MEGLQLNNKVALVTGASRGLGRAMAKGLADAGARVVLASPTIELLKEVEAEIESQHGQGRALAVSTDITRRGDCERVVRACIDRFGGLDVLVNNARRPSRGPGLPLPGRGQPFWEANAEVWQETVNVNVNGTFLLSHVAVPFMIARGWGRIINVTTSLDTMQRRWSSPYGVTKAALESATVIWAKDLEDRGVTVNTLIPGGACDTDPGRAPEERSKLLPVHVMNPLVVWLASDLSNGQTGGRYVGKLWDKRLLPNEAAERAKELPVLRGPGT